MLYKIIRYVAASEIPGATPGKAGGDIAVVVDDLGNEVVMTAAQYRTQEFAKIRALELWQEVRFLQPTEIHPDDFRTLYPELADLTDLEIRKRLERVGTAARTRPSIGSVRGPLSAGPFRLDHHFPRAAVREARLAADDDYTHPGDQEIFDQMRPLPC